MILARTAGRSRRSSAKGIISAASTAPEPITFSTNCGWTSGSAAWAAGHRRLGRVLRSPHLLPGRIERDAEVPLPAVPRVPDLENVVSGHLRSGGSLDPPSPMSIKASLKTRLYVVLVFALACFTPAVGERSNDCAHGAPTDESKTGWRRGTSTTMRGDCQEDCVAHGTGAYLHTGSLLAIVGLRVNPQMNAGVEVSWVPATSQAGDDVRSTFLLATAQFRPWQTRGFFLNGGYGHGLRPQLRLRRNRHDSADHVQGAWTSPTVPDGCSGRHTASGRAGVRHAARGRARGLSDCGGVTAENVIGNFWSVGADRHR